MLLQANSRKFWVATRIPHLTVTLTSTRNILSNMCTWLPTLPDFWPKKYPWLTEQHQ